MSWKSIEMQVALPRVQDAGKVQEQIMKQSQHFQESLAQSQIKLEEEKKKRVNTFENVQAKRIAKEGKGMPPPDHRLNDESQRETSGKCLAHPYLGRHFDFNG